MSNIKIIFTGHSIRLKETTPTIVLTIDEEGNKNATVTRSLSMSEKTGDQPPQRLLKTLTKSAVEKILYKDDIPYSEQPSPLEIVDHLINDGNLFIDGEIFFANYFYHITITKDEITKVYDADDSSIKTYPLLRYLASWFRRLDK